VRFGIRAPAFPVGSGPEELASYAARAESLGLSSFWVPDRLVPVGGYLSFTGAAPLLEPLTSLAFVAARTTRIVLGTAVVIAPLRHPLVLAKAAANVRHLSDGRLILGLGTGWAPEEFAALELPRGQRGSRTDEAIDVLRASFTGEPFDHHGPHHSFSGVRIEPARQPPPPIWGSGGRGAPEYSMVGGAAMAPGCCAASPGWTGG
jgi:alkanesulfonate monooxygenase SsuD/methylene tetrahydromethanopterin reductase-like flavin-dependent oxidoreductase (luciferase family)